MAHQLSQQDISYFKEHGYLIIRDLLSADEATDLQHWAQEVHDWPNNDASPHMSYREINSSGYRVLCRTENHADYHVCFNELLRGSRLLSILGELAGEDMLLFKEKINYKLAGSDRSDMTNGGLEVVDRSHEATIPIGADNCIELSWVEKQTWVPVELEAGQLLILGSYLAHRSAANHSENDRKAIYATYNCAKEGDLHSSYYEDQKRLWPATHMWKSREAYNEGALRYGFGSPMLSIALGKQMEV